MISKGHQLHKMNDTPQSILYPSSILLDDLGTFFLLFNIFCPNIIIVIPPKSVIRPKTWQTFPNVLSL